jgi:hypothetical protein
VLAESCADHAIVYRDLFMSNGTLYILTDAPSEFPPIRLMASHPLAAENTPENIKMREPTPYDMDFLPLAEAQRRWGDDVRNGRKNRVLSVDGNTVCLFLFRSCCSSPSPVMPY